MAVQPKPVPPFAPRRRATTAPQIRRRGDAAGAYRQTSAPPTSPAIVRASYGAGRQSRPGGDFLLLVFFTATMTMVVAVVLVGAVDQWWVLVPVMLVDFVATFAVIVALVQLLRADG